VIFDRVSTEPSPPSFSSKLNGELTINKVLNGWAENVTAIQP
jgi:hypothetical protein